MAFPVVTAAVLALIAASIVWRWWAGSVPSPPAMPVPLTTFLGREVSAKLSPDGRFVGYALKGEGEDNYDVYVQLIGTAEPYQLTSEPADEYFGDWSSNGTGVAYFRKTSESGWAIYTKSVLGGSEREIARTVIRDKLTGVALSWSPSGPTLAIVDEGSPGEREAIFLLSLETLETRRFTQPPEGFWDGNPAFSPDGQTVAFVRYYWDFCQICFQDVESKEARCLNPFPYWVLTVAWTPAGSSIIFTASDPDYYLARISATGGEPRRLPFGTGAREVSISRTGRMLYQVWQQDDNIWRTGGPSAVNPELPALFPGYSTRDEYGPEYSPDGAKVAFVSNRSGTEQIWIANADGSHPRRLTNMRPRSVRPRWSPQGDRLAFWSWERGKETADIFVMDETGGPVRNLTPDEFNDGMPEWSLDGRWIYYNSERPVAWQIWKVSVDGGEPVRVTSQEGLLPRVTQDGQIVFFRQPGAKRDLPGWVAEVWKMSLEGEGERRVWDKVVRPLTSCIWQGRLLYIDVDSKEGPSIEMTDLTSGGTRRLLILPRGTNISDGLTVSPDGRWILYAQIDITRADLMLVENFF